MNFKIVIGIFGLIIIFIFSCFIIVIFFEDPISREIIQEIPSPTGSHKLILQSVDGGATTKHYNKVFILRYDMKLKKDTTPLFLTTDGNIISISWINNMDILIKIKSEELIYYQVVKSYGRNIIVETVDDFK